MSQVVQLENVSFEKASGVGEKNTWIFELPAEVCRNEGYPFGTMVSLTVKGGGIQTTIIRPSTEIDDFVSRIVDEDKEFFKEMKRIGD